jgi:hypothetical protein
VLERVAGPDDVRRAVHLSVMRVRQHLARSHLRRSGPELRRSRGGPRGRPRPRAGAPLLLRARGEAGTRFTHAHGEELARQGEAMEGYAERVVETLTAPATAGTRRRTSAARIAGRDLRAQHNLAIWRGADYLGIGVGAVSTSGGERRRNLPSVARYVAALAAATRRRARSSTSTPRPGGGAAHARAPARRALRGRGRGRRATWSTPTRSSG